MIYIAVAFCLLFPSLGRAQNTGRIECPRNDGYVYLYSSVATLDVRATLQCGEIVQITGRFDDYMGVRNTKGDTGYVPLAAIVLLKDRPGPGLPTSSSGAPARERIHYDDAPREAPAPSHATVPAFTLLKDTPVRVRLLKTFSSASAHVGDPVELEILDDVLVENVTVLSKGAKVSGLIAESDPKKRFGHNGKLAVRITSIQLVDGKPVAVRCYQAVSATSSSSAADGALSISSGKDAVLLQNTEFTALVDVDTPLKREDFASPENHSRPSVPASPQSFLPQQ